MTEEDLLTIQDVSEILSVSNHVIYDWVKQGILTPAAPIEGAPRFRPKDIQVVADQQCAESLQESLHRQARILIVDDDPLVGKSIENFLKQKGFFTITAPIGIAALDYASFEDFDLVIMDIRMPGMNGVEALKAVRDLRKRFGKPSIPEIVLTAYDDAEVRTEVQKLGVRHFILKPFDGEQLLALIQESLVKQS